MDDHPAYVVDAKTGCWLWQQSLNNSGYGSSNGTMAHRAMYAERVAPIPDGMEIHHTCGTRRCVNPDHLTPMTFTEHRALGLDYGPLGPANSRKKECVHGHLFDEENTRWKVNRDGSVERICRTCARERQRTKRAGGPGRGAHLRAKTHCPHGHEYTPENTYINPSRVGRMCRACAGWKGRFHGEKNTHCPQGHPYDETNTRYSDTAGRTCKTCERERHRRRNRALISG